MYVSTAAIIHGDTPLEVNTQGEGDGRIVSFTIGRCGSGEIRVQGDPDVMVAFVDRLRHDLVTAVGRAWPIEDKHTETEVGGHQAGVTCPLDGQQHDLATAVALNAGAVNA
jgi:hypothetical protein